MFRTSSLTMKPVSCVTKSGKGVNNYSVCAFSSSSSHTLHLVCLKLMGPALFHVSFSASHVLPANISASLQLLCTNHVWPGDKDLAQCFPEAQRHHTPGRGQLWSVFLWLLYSLPQICLTAANTGRPRLFSKSRPSLSHLFCILPSSMLRASGIKQPARAWIRFRTLNPWLERWPYAADCLVFLDGPRRTSRGEYNSGTNLANIFKCSISLAKALVTSSFL